MLSTKKLPWWKTSEIFIPQAFRSRVATTFFQKIVQRFSFPKKKNGVSHCQLLPSDPFGCFKWPFQGLSDLHLGYQKVTWKKLVDVMYFFFLLMAAQAAQLNEFLDELPEVPRDKVCVDDSDGYQAQPGQLWGETQWV